MKKFEGFEQIGMKINQAHQVAYGLINGYKFLVRYSAEHRNYTIMTTIKPTGEDTLAGYLETKEKGSFINWMVYKDYSVVINVKNDKKLGVYDLEAIMKDIAYYASQNGYVQCCRHCGQEINVDVCSINGQTDLACPSCFGEYASRQEPVKQVNLPLGIVGAFVGSLIGVAVWVLIYKLGFIAGITGFVMSVCCFKGYEILGGRMDKKGVWIALVIAVIMLAAAEMVSLGLEIYDVYSEYYVMSIFDAMQMVPSFLTEGEIVASVVKDLAFGYVFMAAASFSYIKAVHQEVSSQGVVERIG